MSVSSDFYLAQAIQCRQDADGANLVNVRDRCLRAAAAWQAMADRLLRAEADRKRQAIAKLTDREERLG